MRTADKRQCSTLDNLTSVYEGYCYPFLMSFVSSGCKYDGINYDVMSRLLFFLFFLYAFLFIFSWIYVLGFFHSRLFTTNGILPFTVYVAKVQNVI